MIKNITEDNAVFYLKVNGFKSESFDNFKYQLNKVILILSRRYNLIENSCLINFGMTNEDYFNKTFTVKLYYKLKTR